MTPNDAPTPVTPVHTEPKQAAAAVRRWARPVGGMLAILVVVLLARELGGRLPALAEWVASLGAWGPAAFIVAYALAVVAFVPGALLTLAGGALFGVISGTLYVFIAAVIGSAAAFLIARHLARNAIEQRLARHPRFAAIDRAVAGEGLKIVFLLRLSPAFPFSLLNYALGLTRVEFRDYLLASFGMIPGTLLYVYYGKAAGDIAVLAAGTDVDKGAEYYGVLGLGLLATIAVTTIVTRLARGALEASSGRNDVGESGTSPAQEGGDAGRQQRE